MANTKNTTSDALVTVNEGTPEAHMADLAIQPGAFGTVRVETSSIGDITVETYYRD